CVTHGTLAEPENQGANTFEDPGCKWLWSGYLYITPQVGHDIGDGIQGDQPGANKLGNYHCWNRQYDIQTARWTTPDPAASPWWNQRDYVWGGPLTDGDSTGLSGGYIGLGEPAWDANDPFRTIRDDWILFDADGMGRFPGMTGGSEYHQRWNFRTPPRA